jgi:hypothetical protein
LLIVGKPSPEALAALPTLIWKGPEPAL